MRPDFMGVSFHYEESPIGHRHMAGDLSNPPRVRMWCQACHLHFSSAKEDGQHASKAVGYAPPSALQIISSFIISSASYLYNASSDAPSSRWVADAA